MAKLKISILQLHYLLWFGCLAGILPYVPVFAKEHSIATATRVGVLYTILPFVVSIIKPIFCSIADRYSSHKKILFIFLLFTLIGYGLLLSLPFLKSDYFLNHKELVWYWFCLLVLIANSSMGVVISLTDSLVMKEVREKNKSFGSYRVYGTIGWGGFGLLAGVINETITGLPYLVPGLIMFVVGILVDILCIRIYKNNQHKLNNDSISISDSSCDTDIVTDTVTNTVTDTVDVHTENKTNKKITYNQIIKGLWWTIKKYPSLLQYMILVTVFGVLTAFHWSYYFWFIEEIRGKDPWLMGLCLFVQSFVGEFPAFLFSHKIVQYLGLSISLNISLFIFAFRYFYYGYILTVGTSYWDVLLIEICQGPTFGIFYCVMTAMAQSYADKASKCEHFLSSTSHDRTQVKSGVQSGELNQKELNQNQTVKLKHESNNESIHATMQGIMSGCYEGIGLGLGSLLGGAMIDLLGVFHIWRYAAFFASGILLCNVIIEIIKFTRKNMHRFAFRF